VGTPTFLQSRRCASISTLPAANVPRACASMSITGNRIAVVPTFDLHIDTTHRADGQGRAHGTLQPAAELGLPGEQHSTEGGQALRGRGQFQWREQSAMNMTGAPIAPHVLIQRLTRSLARSRV
jgi:hypothetical protein